jgi:DNA-binding CsgD family transcriptional regulator
MLTDMASRPISPVFVGRERELDALDAALHQVTSGKPAVVVVGGEAGVGKSRLLDEFLVGARLAGARVLVGGCAELGEDGLPFTPVVAALRSLLHDLAPDRIDELLGAGRDDLARLLPELGDSDPGPFLGELSRGRLFEILVDLVERLGREQPLILVLEDLHWADRSTRELFGFLARTLRSSAVLLIATFRSDELHRGHPLRAFVAELDRVRTVDRFELPRFDRAEVVEQLTGILGGAPESSLAEKVFSRSEGNAFFVEELACSALAGDPCGMSDSLRDLLLARVERLGQATQQVLRVASAGGSRVDYRLVAAVVDLPEAALLEELREAVSSSLLVARSDEGGYDGYAFRHSLLREVLHDDLLPGEHSRVHVRYAEALERQPDLVARHRLAAEVAHHWYAAHHLERALPACMAAADEAGRLFAFAEQRRMLERVLEIWDRVPEAERLAGVDRLGVLDQAMDAAHKAGDHERGLALANAAIAEVDREHDPQRAALFLNSRAKLLGQLGRSGGMADLREAEALLPAQDPSRARANVLTSLASALTARPRESLPLSEEAIAAAQAIGDRRIEIRARTIIGCTLSRIGEVERGLAELEQARLIAEQIGDTWLLLHANVNKSDVLESLGRHEDAVATAREGLALARRSGLARTQGAYLIGNLAESLLSLGRWDEADRLVTEALELDPPGVQATLLNYLRGFVMLWRGDRAAAQAHLDAARATLAREYVNDQYQLPVAQLEASLALCRGEPAVAFERAVDELARHEQVASARYVWPLLAVAARASAELAAAARDFRDDEAAPVAAAAVEQVGAAAADLPAGVPVLAGWRAVVSAELARAAGRHDASAWQAAVSAWERTANPAPLAYSLLRHAEATAAAGDRPAAEESARRANEMARQLGARPVLDEIALLARRARLVLAEYVEPVSAQAPVEPRHEDFGLTPREIEVLRGVAAGQSNRQIAVELFISVKTASVHVSNILSKLGVTSRGEAAAFAHRQHLFEDDVVGA